MSSFPRILQTGLTLLWDGSIPVWVRAGSMVDCPPGSALEAAYGGPGNLRLLTPGEVGAPDASDRFAQAN